MDEHLASSCSFVDLGRQRRPGPLALDASGVLVAIARVANTAQLDPVLLCQWDEILSSAGRWRE